MKNNYTDEQREQVKELYLQGKTYREIEELTGVKKGAVGWMISASNLSNRIERKPRTSNDNKICPKCKKHSLSNASYCWNCGNDIRSKSELMIVKYENVLGKMCFMNESVRNEVSEDIRDIMKYLKEVK